MCARRGGATLGCLLGYSALKFGELTPQHGEQQRLKPWRPLQKFQAIHLPPGLTSPGREVEKTLAGALESPISDISTQATLLCPAPGLHRPHVPRGFCPVVLPGTTRDAELSNLTGPRVREAGWDRSVGCSRSARGAKSSSRGDGCGAGARSCGGPHPRGRSLQRSPAGMRGMGAGMRRARLERERREWRCHPHLGEETRPERGRAARRGGAQGTWGRRSPGDRGQARDQARPRKPGEPAGPLAPLPLAPTRLGSDLPISRSHPAPHIPRWR